MGFDKLRESHGTGSVTIPNWAAGQYIIRSRSQYLLELFRVMFIISL